MAQGTGKTKYTTYLDGDVAKRIEDLKDNHGVKDAEALRRVINTGLSKDSKGRQFGQDMHNVATNLWVLGMVVAVIGLFYPSEQIDSGLAMSMMLVFFVFGTGAALLADYYADHYGEEEF